MLKTLEKLCMIDGISGNEENVREFIKAHAAKYTDEIRTDALGNLIVVKRAKASSKSDKVSSRTAAANGKKLPTLMLTAHMDEVGFMVMGITEGGYIKFAPVGGIDPRIAFNRRVSVGEKKIPGVTGLRAVHMNSKEDRNRILSWNEMYIDIGTSSREETEKLVSVGEPIAFYSDFTRFGSGDNFIKSKAIDDRYGCAVMMKLLEKDLPMDVTFVWSVQEEVGTRGAFGAAFSVKPDIALILEGTTSADLAGVEGHKKVTSLGAGPVLGFMDAGTIYDRELFEGLRELAEENKIPWQIKGRIAGGTDASAIQRSRSGVRVASISAPVRSIHCPNSVAKISDMKHGLRLAELFIDAVASGRIK